MKAWAWVSADLTSNPARPHPSCVTLGKSLLTSPSAGGLRGLFRGLDDLHVSHLAYFLECKRYSMHICYKGKYITDLRSVVWKLVYLLLTSDIMIEFLGGASIFWRGGQLFFSLEGPNIYCY